MLSRAAIQLPRLRGRERLGERRAALGFWLASAAVCALGAAIRLLPSSLHGLWLDESTSLTSALEPRPDQALVSALLHESHPPLYNLLLWAWIHLLPSVEGARLLSVLAGTAAIALAMVLAAGLWGRPAALVAGALGAVNPWHAYYSAEIRMYALESALGMLTLLAAWKAIRRGTRWDWTLYAASALAFAWSEFFAMFALAGLAVWVSLRAPLPAGSVRRSRIAHAVIAAGLVPLLPLVAGSLVRGAGSGDRSGVLRLATLLADLGAGFAAPAWIQLAGAGSALVVLALVALRLRSEPGLTLMAVYVFPPIAIVFAAGLVRPVWVERSLLFVVPALWVLAAGIAVKGAGPVFRPSGRLAPIAVFAFGLAGLAALPAQQGADGSRYQRLPSARAYDFVAGREAHGERFLNADVATAAPLIARDRLNHRATLQWEASAQRRPQVAALVQSGLPSFVAADLLQLQGRLAWDPATTRVTYAEIDRWSNQGDGFWLVVLERPDSTMGAPMKRLDERLSGGGAADGASTPVAGWIPSSYQPDQRLLIEGTLFVHLSRSDR